MKPIEFSAPFALISFILWSSIGAQSAPTPQVGPSAEAVQRCASAPGGSAPPKLSRSLPLDEYYPAVSRRVGEEGRVVVSVHIDANGRPVPASVTASTSSTYPNLDQGAIRWVLNTRFLPGCELRKPVAKTVLLPVSFKLDNGVSANQAVQSSQSPQGQTRVATNSSSQKQSTQCNRPGPQMAHNPQVPGEQWGGWAFFMLNKDATVSETYTAALKIVGRSVLSYQNACQVSAYKVGQAACDILGANCVSIGGCMANSDMVVASPQDDSWLFVGCGPNFDVATANAIAECERKSGCKCSQHRSNISWLGVSRVGGSYHTQSCASVASANAAAVGNQVRQYPPSTPLVIVPSK